MSIFIFTILSELFGKRFSIGGAIYGLISCSRIERSTTQLQLSSSARLKSRSGVIEEDEQVGLYSK